MTAGLAIDGPICHLNLAPEFRGGERQTEILIRELASRGYPQRLVIKRGHVLRERCADVEGLEVREVAPNPVAAGLAVRGSRIAHSHDGRTVYSVLLAKLLFNTPYLITRRIVAPQTRKVLRRWAYREARQLVAISAATATEMRKQFDEKEAAIVPDATAGFSAEMESVERIRARYPGKVLLGHIGALVQSHKGQMTIIQAARLAAESHPEWQFLLCGDGCDEQRFRDASSDLQNIELTGWIDNVGDYLQSLDVFLYPSLHEALGSTLLDAMQFGLPVVASNVGGIPEYIEDGVNGKLVEPADPEQLVDAIAALLADSTSLAEIRERNRRKASRYGAEQMADAYLELYELA